MNDSIEKDHDLTEKENLLMRNGYRHNASSHEWINSAKHYYLSHELIRDMPIHQLENTLHFDYHAKSINLTDILLVKYKNMPKDLYNEHRTRIESDEIIFKIYETHKKNKNIRQNLLFTIDFTLYRAWGMDRVVNIDIYTLNKFTFDMFQKDIRLCIEPDMMRKLGLVKTKHNILSLENQLINEMHQQLEVIDFSQNIIIPSSNNNGNGTKRQCVCNINTIMVSGCKCGGI